MPNQWRQKKGNKTFIRKRKHSFKAQRPSQEEDWEKELEEISERREKQKQPPYGNFMYK